MPRPRPPAVAPTPMPEVPEVVDTTRDARVRRVLDLLACGSPEATIARTVAREFSVSLEQGKIDYADTRDMVRAHLDNEGAIDGVMVGAMARLHMLVQEFLGLALEPVPSRALDTLGTNPDDPEEGALYRPLTVAERSTAVATKARSAEIALKANDALTALVGRRSQRWAPKPANVIQIGGGEGLSPEDRELLKALGMSE